MKSKKILILGISGMLGHTLYLHLVNSSNFEVTGTIRSKRDLCFFKKIKNNQIKVIENLSKRKILEKLIFSNQFDYVINCIGAVKQNKKISDTNFININSKFPILLEKILFNSNTRLIHISTDCVFDGLNGNYKENNKNYASDIYGLSKLLGETKKINSLTIRTSIIGHELKYKYGLLEWFINSKEKKIKGYNNVYFSGLTTYELSRVIHEIIMLKNKLSGIYHISSNRISKFKLLNKINKKYNHIKKNIIEFESTFLDRSLNSNKFFKKTGIKIQVWDRMINDMFIQYKNQKYLYGKKKL